MADGYVGKPCPKCKHVRAAAEIAPDWQCPKCGVAYAKFLQSQSGTAPAAPARSASAGRGSAPQAAVDLPAEKSTGLAMFAHLSVVIGIFIPFLGIIVPLVIWVAKKGENDFAVSCAKEAINFQITMLLWLVAISAPVFVFPPLMIPMAVVALVLAIAYLVLPIIATVKASGGDIYAYPYTWHLFS